MTQAARWIRLGRIDPIDLHAAYAGIAAAQGEDAEPVLLWAQSSGRLCFLQSAAPTDRDVATPMVRRPNGGALLEVEADQYLFVLVVPLRHAPGRASRWYAWALAPAVATCRAFGVSAQLQDHDIWLQGRRVGGCAAATLGHCAVLAAGFPLPFAAAMSGGTGTERPPGFRSWLRRGLSLPLSQWTGHGAPPSERELETVFRERLEAQHDWRFENAWTGAAEQAAIVDARSALVDAEDPGDARAGRSPVRASVAG